MKRAWGKALAQGLVLALVVVAGLVLAAWPVGRTPPLSPDARHAHCDAMREALASRPDRLGEGASGLLITWRLVCQ